MWVEVMTVVMMMVVLYHYARRYNANFTIAGVIRVVTDPNEFFHR